jgi:hypothetical protein
MPWEGYQRGMSECLHVWAVSLADEVDVALPVPRPRGPSIVSVAAVSSPNAIRMQRGKATGSMLAPVCGWTRRPVSTETVKPRTSAPSKASKPRRPTALEDDPAAEALGL